MTAARQSARRFTVGVNLLWMVPGNVGGTEEYATRLLRAVPEVDRPGTDRIDYRIFATPAVAAVHHWLSELGEVVVSPDPGTSRIRRVGLEATWLGRASRGCAFVHHLGGTLPVRNRVPAVTTIHDLQPIDQPESFGSVKARWLAHRLPAAVVESSLVLTPSQWVADRIVAVCDGDPSRIVVVPSSHSNPTAASGANEIAAGRAAAELGITRPYVLYPAISYPHKNHEVLIEAMGSVDAEVDLVLTGRPDAAHDDIVRAIDRLALRGRVHVTGRVEPALFSGVLAGAQALVFPSTYEGFGLPLIEAMARGVPVIASDLPVLREVASDTATWVVPTDPLAWARAIERAATSESDPATLAAAQRRADDFSPIAGATRLIDVYRRVLGLDYWDREQPEEQTG